MLRGRGVSASATCDGKHHDIKVMWSTEVEEFIDGEGIRASSR